MRGTGDNFRQSETSNVKKQLSPKTQIASGYWKSVTMSSCLVVPGAAFHCFTQLDTVLVFYQNIRLIVLPGDQTRL